MAVELANRQVRGHTDASLERRQRDLGLLAQPLFWNVLWNVLRYSLQRLRVDLGRVEHVVSPLGSRQQWAGAQGGVLLSQRFLNSIERELVVVWRTFVPLDCI